MRELIEKEIRFATEEELSSFAKYHIDILKKGVNKKIISDTDDEIDVYLKYKNRIASCVVNTLVFNTGEIVVLYSVLILWEEFCDEGNFDVEYSIYEYKDGKFTDIEFNDFPYLFPPINEQQQGK